MESEPQPPTIRCHRPWQEVIIDSDGTVTPCCYWSAYGNCNEAMGNTNESTVEEIWNGRAYRELRRHMAAGDLAAAGCAGCYAIKQDFDLQLLFDPDALGSDTPYGRNLTILLDEIKTGKERLNASPTLVAIAPSHHCHLQCLHCSQEPTRHLQLSKPDTLDQVLSLVPRLVRLNAVGGEPFILPAWRNFLRSFDPKDAPYLCFSTCTSATLIAEEVFTQLEHFKTVNINISVDGTGKTYERVRVNAKWNVVIDNIRRIGRIVDAKPGSTLGFSMSVMRSNITDLPNFIRFATEHDRLFSIIPVTTPLPESLVSFADGPWETEAWRKALSEARTVIEQEWLSRHYPSGADNRERGVWLGSVDLISNTVPWTALHRPYFRAHAALPGDMEMTGTDGSRYHLGERVVSGEVYAHIFEAGERRSVPVHNARLQIDEGGRVIFLAALPAGRFEALFGSKWAIEFRDWITIVVPEGTVAGTPVEAQWQMGPWAALWRLAAVAGGLYQRLTGLAHDARSG